MAKGEPGAAEVKAAEDNNFTPKADMIDKTRMLNSFLLSLYLDNLKRSPERNEKYNSFSVFKLEFQKVNFLQCKFL